MRGAVACAWGSCARGAIVSAWGNRESVIWQPCFLCFFLNEKEACAMFHRFLMSLCVLTLAFCVAGPASAGTFVADPYSGSQWYVTPLGIPNSTQFSVATGINSNGQIVGYFGNGVDIGTSPSEFQSNRNSDGTGGTFVSGRRHGQHSADDDQCQRHERGH